MIRQTAKPVAQTHAALSKVLTKMGVDWCCLPLQESCLAWAVVADVTTDPTFMYAANEAKIGLVTV